MESPEPHPLIAAGLPEWLKQVPLDAPKPTWVTLSEGKVISADHLHHALQLDQGEASTSLSILPELVQPFSTFTENPAWQNTP